MGFSKAALVVAVVALTCNDPSLFRDIHSLWYQVREWKSFGTNGPGIASLLSPPGLRVAVLSVGLRMGTVLELQER